MKGKSERRTNFPQGREETRRERETPEGGEARRDESGTGGQGGIVVVSIALTADAQQAIVTDI